MAFVGLRSWDSIDFYNLHVNIRVCGLCVHVFRYFFVCFKIYYGYLHIPSYPSHPPGQVVKWNKTSNTSFEDFKYFNWGVQILSLNSNSTPAQSQLNSIWTQLNSTYWAWQYSAQACYKYWLMLVIRVSS